MLMKVIQISLQGCIFLNTKATLS